LYFITCSFGIFNNFGLFLVFKCYNIVITMAKTEKKDLFNSLWTTMWILCIFMVFFLLIIYINNSIQSKCISYEYKISIRIVLSNYKALINNSIFCILIVISKVVETTICYLFVSCVYYNNLVIFHLTYFRLQTLDVYVIYILYSWYGYTVICRALDFSTNYLLND